MSQMKSFEIFASPNACAVSVMPLSDRRGGYAGFDDVRQLLVRERDFVGGTR